MEFKLFSTEDTQPSICTKLEICNRVTHDITIYSLTYLNVNWLTIIMGDIMFPIQASVIRDMAHFRDFSENIRTYTTLDENNITQTDKIGSIISICSIPNFNI